MSSIDNTVGEFEEFLFTKGMLSDGCRSRMMVTSRQNPQKVSLGLYTRHAGRQRFFHIFEVAYFQVLFVTRLGFCGQF